MTDSEVRPFPTPLEAPLARLRGRRDELTKAWLLRFLEQASLEEIERMPTDRLARELPQVVSGVLEAAAQSELDGGTDIPPAARAGAAALATMRAGIGGSARDLVADVSSLQALATAGLRAELAEADPHLLANAIERLALAFGALQSVAVDEFVARRSRELERLAHTDELTGLYNVRHLRDRLRHQHDLYIRYGHPFSVLVLDIDGLKRLNDSRGHAAGDRALIAVAEAVQAAIRSVDTAVRVGGDEFCVVAPQQTAARAAVLANRIVRAVLDSQADGEVPLGVSIGVVACPQHGTEPDVLLELADEAMYRAKASGEGVQVAIPDDRPAANAEAQ